VNPNYLPSTSQVLGFTSKTVKVFETDEIDWYKPLWTDANGDALTFTFESNDTGFATLNLSTLKITLAPTSDAQVGTYSIGIKVDDGFGGITMVMFPVTIVANEPPTFVSSYN